MGSTATQGLAALVFLVAFAFLAGAFFADGNLLLLGAFVLVAASSAVLFQKAKALDGAEKR